MNPETRFRELLSKLLDDDFSIEEREELARLCDADESLRDSLRSELELAELIRQATSDSEEAGHHFFQSLESRISGEMPTFDSLAERLIAGEADDKDIDDLVRHCWRDEENALQLRRALKWADLLEQAATGRRSGESFVESLATRMWAEQEQDRFVEKTQSKIVSLFPDSAQPAEPSHETSLFLSFGTWATAAAAAIALGAVFLVNRPENAIAEIVHNTDDVRWKTGPKTSGHLAKGLYELDSGVVTLEFANGTQMTIEGPAEFDLRGGNEAFVHSGIALLDQHGGGSGPNSGFTLQSKGLHLVDTHDTVGIDARSTFATEAIVFNGGTEVCLPAAAGNCRNLYEYEAVRVDLKRGKLFDIPYNPRVFARSWEVLAGVEGSKGSTRIELPGTKPKKAESGEAMVQIFVERDHFVSDGPIEVDALVPGHFSSASDAEGKVLAAGGELRSYLLQLWPKGSGEGGAKLEASVTFDHEIVGVIYSSERLESSDSIVGSEVVADELSSSRGLDASGKEGDSILLSNDRRTVNLRLQSGSESDQLDHVRVLVALR